MKSILITNAYSYKNKGDAGIILSMIDLLKEKYPDAHIQIMSRNYNENKEYYDQIYDNVTSIKPIWYINNKHNHNKIMQLFFAALSLLKCMFIMLFYMLLKDKLKTVPFIKKNKSLIAYLDANMVCSCGGGYLFSTNKWPISIGLYQHLFHIYLGKFFNKQVIMFPQSIGPINKKIDKVLTKKLLKKVDMIYPREEFSYQFLIESGFSSERVNKLPDVAFTMGVEKYPFKDASGLKIGITVLDWHWAYSDVEEGKKR
ncbi:polysaccharide pyruvyl transferase family protein [Bacillus cereus]